MSSAGETHSSPGTLYCVATPLGNPQDITLRAMDILARVELVACEDTRHAGLLLHRLAVEHKPRLVSVFEHNEQRRIPEILRVLEQGMDVALISEAGTPTISDPGYRLVRQCINEGIPVVPVPGPCAVTAALSASGLPTDRFLFLGFPPRKGSRLTRFVRWATQPGLTSVVYLPARRMEEFLGLLEATAPEARVVVAREMTKGWEEFLRGTPGELLEPVRERPNRGAVALMKGECTLVIHREGRARHLSPEFLEEQDDGCSTGKP